jgi:hypothetical protein
LGEVKVWLSELWNDSTAFRGAVRGLGVAGGLVLLTAAADLERVTAVPQSIWQALGVMLTGGSSTISKTLPGK